MEIVISNHGLERLVERGCCKRGAAQEFIKKVWESGKKIADFTTKETRKYLQNIAREKGGETREIRVSGNFVYLFVPNKNVFVTCYEMNKKVIQKKNKNRQKVYFYD